MMFFECLMFYSNETPWTPVETLLICTDTSLIHGNNSYFELQSLFWGTEQVFTENIYFIVLIIIYEISF